MSEMGFDDFLNHDSSSKGGGGFVKNWKEAGSIIVWPHPRATIHALWFHNWYELDTRAEDEEAGEANPLGEYRTRRMNCIESEEVLKKQRFRDRDGRRERPPEICPHCLMMEWVREEIEEGRLDWKKPIFKFGDIVLHAGGITGMFNDRNLSDAQKTELRRAGFRMDEVFREQGSAQLNYVLRAVEHDSPADGAKIMFLKQSLGDKLKASIKARFNEYAKSNRSREQADPRNNPVAFEFTFDEKKQFAEKYGCERLEMLQRPAGLDDAFAMDPPDVDRVIADPDWGRYHASLEQHCLIEMPFDEFFAPLEKKLGKKVESSVAQDEDDFPADYGKAAKKNVAPAADDNLVACDRCGKGFADSEMTCPHCGAEYEEVDGVVTLKPEAEPPPRRRRGSK